MTISPNSHPSVFHLRSITLTRDAEVLAFAAAIPNDVITRVALRGRASNSANRNASSGLHVTLLIERVHVCSAHSSLVKNPRFLARRCSTYASEVGTHLHVSCAPG